MVSFDACNARALVRKLSIKSITKLWKSGRPKGEWWIPSNPQTHTKIHHRRANNAPSTASNSNELLLYSIYTIIEQFVSVEKRTFSDDSCPLSGNTFISIYLFVFAFGYWKAATASLMSGCARRARTLFNRINWLVQLAALAHQTIYWAVASLSVYSKRLDVILSRQKEKTRPSICRLCYAIYFGDFFCDIARRNRDFVRFFSRAIKRGLCVCFSRTPRIFDYARAVAHLCSQSLSPGRHHHLVNVGGQLNARSVASQLLRARIVIIMPSQRNARGSSSAPKMTAARWLRNEFLKSFPVAEKTQTRGPIMLVHHGWFGTMKKYVI